MERPGSPVGRGGNQILKRASIMSSEFLRIALGLLSAIGPFAIDMYLPALPSIGADLHAGPPPR